MIFTERTITVVNDSATINKPLILYRGDKNIELKITIAESQFKFRNTDASNVIETTDASYAQLVINTPYNSPIFSDVAATKNGAVIFVITEAMIDEIREVGAYEIQIRLLDDNKQSRASIPPVSNAIEIREPIAIEDGSAVDSNAVNVAKVNRALTTTSAPLEVFDSQGNYIKKTWGDGDPITDAALNKMEAGIDGVNKKIANVNNINDTTASATTTYSSNKIETIKRNISSQINDKVAVVGENSIIPINLVKKSITADEVNFLTTESSNLFNKNRVSLSKTINYDTGKIEDATDTCVSEPIYVDLHKKIVLNNYSYNNIIAKYSESTGFIGSIYDSNITNDGTFDYIRIVVTNSKLDNFFVCYEDVASGGYTPYLKNIKLSKDISVSEESLPYTKNEIMKETIKSINIDETQASFIELIAPINWLNPNDLDITDGYIDGDGNFLDTSNYKTTGYIPCKSGKTYTLSNNSDVITFYDENKLQKSQIWNKTTFVSSTDGFFRLSIVAQSFNNFIINGMIVEGNVLPDAYSSYFKPYYQLKNITVTQNSIKDFDLIQKILKVEPLWSDKTYLAIGDSITECLGAPSLDTTYPYLIKNKLGFGKMYRCAYYGKKMKDIDEIIAHSATITDGIQSEANIREADVITIFLGQNDIGKNIGSIDDVPDNNGAFYASCKYTLNKIIGLNPTARILLITPTPSKDFLDDLLAVRNAIIEIGKLYKLEVIDMYYECGFNELTYETFYTTSQDYVHPTYDKGHYRLYEIIRKHIGN